MTKINNDSKSNTAQFGRSKYSNLNLPCSSSQHNQNDNYCYKQYQDNTCGINRCDYDNFYKIIDYISIIHVVAEAPL